MHPDIAVSDPALLAFLGQPPDVVAEVPPVLGRLQTLPFGELTWENFERLCFRIATEDKRVEHSARYGNPGQNQDGIDLFVRYPDRLYDVWQIKRYKKVIPSDIREAVRVFRDGDWAGKCGRLIFAAQASLSDKNIQDVIEEEAASLRESGISFVPYDGEKIGLLLKDFPRIIDDFFGREWVRAFLGDECAGALGNRLDGGEFASVKNQISKFYSSHFNLLDLGTAPFVSEQRPETADILDRFTMPDIFIKDVIIDEQRSASFSGAQTAQAGEGTSDPESIGHVNRRTYSRRIPLASWLVDGNKSLLVGDAGAGKSTVLRCIALDVLYGRGVFSKIAHKWADLLPIHLSFSRWSRLTAKLNRVASLKEIVNETIQSGLTANLSSLLDRAIDERRILILLDGLDEWSAEQAARTTLLHIFTVIETHSIPIVATARPRGLDRVGRIPTSWRAAEIAPLSEVQQRRLANVWFRNFSSPDGDVARGEENQPVEVRVNKFFSELARDVKLEELASNPLLLLGLTILSLRRVALPRNKVDALNELIKILIETHPNQRATEAGDTESRFSGSVGASDRRAALAFLAYSMRLLSGGGGYRRDEAIECVKRFLSDPNESAFSAEVSRKTSDELLAVNSETVGLLVERSTDEISFSHAVFEELLAAEYLQTLPFEKVLCFVIETAESPLWRNVIGNLVTLTQRRDEVDKIVSVIEEKNSEDKNPIRLINRTLLLSDIAFGPARLSPEVSRRLVRAAFGVVETGESLSLRRKVLRVVLENRGYLPEVYGLDEKIKTWAPCRTEYLESLFSALENWEASDEVCEVLFKGLYGERWENRRGAAAALGRLFKGDSGVQLQLVKALRLSRDPAIFAGLLEALTTGWGETPGLAELHDQARISEDFKLQYIGVLGRLKAGRYDDTDLSILVKIASSVSLFFGFNDLTGFLVKYWPNKIKLIELSLGAQNVNGYQHSNLDRSVSIEYLLGCSASNPTVVNWVRGVLNKEYAFSSVGDHNIEGLSKFILANDSIRRDFVRLISNDNGRFLHEYVDIISRVGGDDLRDILIGIVESSDSFDRYWALSALINGWSGRDGLVDDFLKRIATWDDAELGDLASLLPVIISERKACRDRLLSIARNLPRPRMDLIAKGLGILGCVDDSEVVELLLSRVAKRGLAFDPWPNIIKYFHKNSLVRNRVLRVISGSEPEFNLIALHYYDDAEVRAALLSMVTPLIAELRGDIYELFSNNFYSQDNDLLKNYEAECDMDLLVQGSINYHRSIVFSEPSVIEDRSRYLTSELSAVGPYHEQRVAAAFAGMIVLGEEKRIASLKDFQGNPLKIEIGNGYGRESKSLLALMAENWDKIIETFGNDFLSRFGQVSLPGGAFWERMAPYIGTYPTAIHSFISFCGDDRSLLGVEGLRFLSREMPGSELLLGHCLKLLRRGGRRDNRSLYNDLGVIRAKMAAAYIYRDNFSSNDDIDTIIDECGVGYDVDLAAYSLMRPNHIIFSNIKHGPIEMAKNYYWNTAFHVARLRKNPKEIFEVMIEIVNRRSNGPWDMQDFLNIAILDEMKFNYDLVEMIRGRLQKTNSPNEIASFSRYISQVVPVSDELLHVLEELLQREAEAIVPRAGYDGLSDAVRGVSLSLLDAMELDALN